MTGRPFLFVLLAACGSNTANDVASTASAGGSGSSGGAAAGQAGVAAQAGAGQAGASGSSGGAGKSGGAAGATTAGKGGVSGAGSAGAGGLSGGTGVGGLSGSSGGGAGGASGLSGSSGVGGAAGASGSASAGGLAGGGAGGAAGASGSSGASGAGSCVAHSDLPGPVEMVAPAANLLSLEVDGANVYWGGLDGVYSAPKNGGGPVVTLLSEPGLWTFVSLAQPEYLSVTAVASKPAFAYLGASLPVGAWRVPRLGGASTALEAPLFGPIASLGDTLYFPGPSTLDGGGMIVPFDPLFSIVQYHGSLVSSFGGRLYWNVSRNKSMLPPAPMEWDFRVYDPVAKTFQTVASFPFNGDSTYRGIAANSDYVCSGELIACTSITTPGSALLPKLLPPGHGIRQQVAMDDTHVYLSEYVASDVCEGVRRALPTGDQQQVVYAAPTQVFGLALDDVYVYFFDEAKGAIMRIKK
jgi:hypothetical protein